MRYSISFESSWAVRVNQLIRYSICTSRVRWNWSPTASLEGRSWKWEWIDLKHIDPWDSAYHSKALELTSSTNLAGCQCAHRGCAGIGRQLHPLKADTWLVCFYLEQRPIYAVQHIIWKLLNWRVQLMYQLVNMHIEGVLELVANCIPWRPLADQPNRRLKFITGPLPQIRRPAESPNG